MPWKTLPTLQEYVRQPSPIPNYEQNLIERGEILLRCDTDLGYRAHEIALSSKDPVHWAKYHLDIFEPRNNGLEAKRINFCPYEFQEWLIWYMWDAIDLCSRQTRGVGRNIAIPKCRDMAATWTMLIVFLHRWRFYNDSFLLISANEAKVDKRGDYGCLFEKLRFLLRSMPDYWLPEGFDWKHHDKENLLINPAGGEICGEATTAKSGRSHRVTALGFDEVAAVDPGKDFKAWAANAGSTNLRFAISTPDGEENLFGKMATDDFGEEVEIVRLEWWLHPEKIHTFIPQEKLEPLTPEERDKLLASFRRVCDLKLINGQPTSQWYEAERKRLDPQTFAKEVEIDFRKSKKGGVWDESFKPALHLRRGIMPDPDTRLIISMDPGTHWFSIITQVDRWNNYSVFRERYFENANIDYVLEVMQQIWKEEFGMQDADWIGDPAGNNVNSSMHKGKSEWMYFYEQAGIVVQSEFMGRMFKQEDWVTARINAMNGRLAKIAPDGERAAFLIDPDRCKLAHKALNGGYRWEVDPYNQLLPRVQQKHPMEDAADALCYPLIFKGLFAPPSIDRRPKPPASRRGSVNWERPSQMGRGNSWRTP